MSQYNKNARNIAVFHDISSVYMVILHQKYSFTEIEERVRKFFIK